MTFAIFVVKMSARRHRPCGGRRRKRTQRRRVRNRHIADLRGLALTVRSTLLAGEEDGETEVIRFTSAAEFPEPGDWAGIRFTPESVDAELDGQNYQSGSIIDRALIEYAGSTQQFRGVIDLDGAVPFVRDATVLNSSATGCLVCVNAAPGTQLVKLRVIGGIAPIAVRINHATASPDPVVLTEAEITGNSGTGISLEQGRLIVRDDTNVSNNGGDGISISGFSQAFILRSIVSDNGGHGIATSGGLRAHFW